MNQVDQKLFVASIAFESEILNLQELSAVCGRLEQPKASTAILASELGLDAKTRQLLEHVANDRQRLYGSFAKFCEQNHSTNLNQFLQVVAECKNPEIANRLPGSESNPTESAPDQDAFQTISLSDTEEQFQTPEAVKTHDTHPPTDSQATLDPLATQASPDAKPRSSKTSHPTHRVRYQKIREHAEGGLGKVFVAIDEELNRQVALKQIQERFVENDQAKQRFMLEAEITGGLEHPGVVPVYGLGIHADGNPYYAMRFVQGESFESAIEFFHKKFRNASQGKRAELKQFELRKLVGRLISVCQAIGYAHDRGVLHRDIKPENIMLGKFGETLVVDWGLAKVNDLPEERALAQHGILPISGGDTAPTQLGSIIGTPAYMSPEQAQGHSESISFQSDVYSLGATLYTLLIGRAPFGSLDSDGNRRSIEELLEAVRGGNFDAPRQVDPHISRPLESICLRAMARNHGDRYDSALNMAEDLERWLADEPVHAYAENFVEQSRRWIKRHQSIAASVAAIVGVSILGLSSFSLVLRQKNQKLAELAGSLTVKNTMLDESNRELQLAEAKAKEEAAISIAVSDFLNDDLLSQASPHEYPDPDLKVRTILERAAKSLETEFKQQPMVRANLLTTIGVAFRHLGNLDQAESALAESLSIRERRLPTDPKTLATKAKLGAVQGELGQYQQARTLLEDTLHRQIEMLGEDSVDVIETKGELAHLCAWLGDFERAEELADAALNAHIQRSGPRDAGTLEFQAMKVNLWNLAGKFKQALQLAKSSLATAEKSLGPEHLITLELKMLLAQRMFYEEQYDESRKLYEEVIEGMTQLLGDNHPYIDAARNDLALINSEVGDPTAALRTLDEIAARSRESFGAHHRETIVAEANAADIRHSLGESDQARTTLEELVARSGKSLGTDHDTTKMTRTMLAMVYLDQEEYDSTRKILEPWTETDGLDRPSVYDIEAFALLGRMHFELEEYDQAIEWLMQAHQGYLKLGLVRSQVFVTINRSLFFCLAYANQSTRADELLKSFQSRFGDESPMYYLAAIMLADAWIEVDQISKANEQLKPVSTLLEQHALDSREFLNVAYEYAGTLTSLERYPEAIEVYRPAVAKQAELLGAEHSDTLTTQADLAYALSEAGKTEEAYKLFETTLHSLESQYGMRHEQTIMVLENLIQVQIATEDRAKAIDSLRSLIDARTANKYSDQDLIAEHYLLAEQLRESGEYAEAAIHYKTTMEAEIATLGELHEDTLLTMHQLAFTYSEAEEIDLALEYYQRVTRNRIELLGSSHPHTLRSFSNLVRILGKRSDQVVESRLYEELASIVSELDPNDPPTIEASYALGEFYRNSQQYQQALEWYERALAGQQKTLGTKHPDAILSMHQIAFSLEKLKRPAEAAEKYKQVVELRTEVLGPAHEHTQLSLANWAKIVEAEGNFRRAAELYQDLLDRITNASGREHYSTLAPRLSLGSLQYKMERYRQAILLFRECIEIAWKQLPDDADAAARAGVATLLIILADAEIHDGRLEDAYAHTNQGLQIIEKDAPENWIRFRGHSVLGQCLTMRQEYRDAEKSLMLAIEGYDSQRDSIAPAQYNRLRRDTLQRLISLYQATDNTAEFTRWTEVLEHASRE